MLEYDIETTGLQWYYHEMFSAQFLAGGNTLTVRTDEHPNEKIQKALDRAADNGGIRAWNSKFDLGFTHHAGYKLPPDHLWHDGMLMAHIIDETSSVALKARGEKLFGVDERDDEQAVKDWLTAERRRRRKESKETGERYVPPNYRDVPEEIMGPYGEQDVILQAKVCAVYEQQLSMNDKLRDVYNLERDVMVALFWAEQRGVPVDRRAAALLEKNLLDSRDIKEKHLKDLAGIDTFNPNAPAQIAEALERRGVDLRGVPQTKTGARQMNVEVLEQIDDPLAAEVLAWKSDNKLLTTYLDPMLHGKDDKTWGRQAPFIADDERIHPNFRQLGAITGRMSSADPNMQNWPRDDLRLRYLVRAEPGKKLVCCDLDAIEMRLFAAFAGRGAMLEQVRQPDGDPHSYTAYHVGIEDKRRGNDVTPARQRAKVFNFCRPLDVEILTRTGWKTHAEVAVGDETIGYNTETGRTEWTRITAVERGYGPLERMGNKHWQVTATPNHRWLAAPLRKDKGAGGRDYSPTKHGVSLVEQRNLAPEHSLIWNAPGSLGGDGADLPLDSKEAPDVLSMTDEQRRAWLHAMLLGEGTILKSGRFSIAQNEGPILDAIELAVLLEGYRPVRYGGGTSPSVSISGGREYSTTQRVTRTPLGDGEVWCVQTELGTWMAREGKHIGLTGNSMIYGGGLKTIQSFFGVSRSRASEMLDRYHEAYPEISRLQQNIRLKLEDQGYVTTPWGRRHRVDQRKPVYEQAYKFPNKLIQGTAADLLKEAIRRIHAEGIEFILPVHDEIIAHVDEADAEEAARLIEHHMTDHADKIHNVPITAEAVIVDRWSDAKQPGYVPDYMKED
jgi:DNA polymerase I-like protein with 3'-5' exonuclease and polymerase domains